MFDPTADVIFADGPAANPNQPQKAMLRKYFRQFETFMAAGYTNTGLVYDTKAGLFGNLTPSQNSSAWVINDPVPANNGIWLKSGASGTGTWVRSADLPYSVIYAQNDGSGTANAVIATASVSVSASVYSQLISVPFTADNTGPMTISINGEAPRPLVTNTGEPIPSGYISTGMSALVQIDSDGNYRLFSYGDASAIQAAAEAAQTAAETARNQAIAAASTVTAPKATIALAEADTPAMAPQYYDIAYYDTNYVTGSGAKYRQAASEPTHNGKFSITLADGTTTVWYEIAEEVVYASMLGGEVGSASDQSTKVQDALDALPSNGGRVVVDRGIKFNLKSLTFPPKGDLVYACEDELNQNPFTTRASGEVVIFVFGSNSNGIVNEHLIASPYGTGLAVNVQKDVPGQDGYLGSGQQRVPTASVSAKTFIIMESERVSTFGVISEEYGGPTKSEYDGVKLHYYTRRLTINVDSTTGFASGFVGGEKIQGLTSGAFGYFRSKTATSVTIDWQYSKFVAGEKLYDFIGADSQPVISSLETMDVTPGQHQWFGPRGEITWGMAPGYAKTDYSMGGRLTLTKTYDYSQRRLEDITNPALVFCKDVASAPTVGRQIVLDNSNRLVSVKGTAISTGSNATALVSAVSAACRFVPTPAVATGAFNVSGISYVGVGQY